MRVLFWGTPDFAVPSLQALLQGGHQIVGVVTQPDRPAGRGRRMQGSPVRALAESFQIPVLTPERPRGDSFREQLEGLAPELSVVVAYGHILRAEILDLPPLGSINVHASLLPLLRGAAPIHHAILEGHPRTGITIMRMTPGMDEGPILLQRDLPIGPDETTGELHDRLATLGAGLLAEALAQMEGGGGITEVPQPEGATYAPKVGRETARLDWSASAAELSRRVRAMDPAPGAWTTLDGAALKLFRPALEPLSEEEEGTRPGELLPGDGLRVRAVDGSLRFAEVQPPGGRRLPSEEWRRGRRIESGTCLQ